MQLKINWLDADAKFYGLKKIQLHSMNQDNSPMRERLAFWLFRAMGVPAPRSVHARVVINGQYVGLFALTEEVTRHLRGRILKMAMATFTRKSGHWT